MQIRTPSPRTRRRTAPVGLVALALAATLGTAPAAAQSTTEVLLTDANRFEPSTVSIDEGDTVAFRWEGGNTHNVTFADGPSSETTGDGGVNFERTFDEAGSFDFTCTIHPTTMNGTVTVAAAAADTTPTPPPAEDEDDGEVAPTDDQASDVPQPRRVDAGTAGDAAPVGSWTLFAIVLGMLGLGVPVAAAAGRRRA